MGNIAQTGYANELLLRQLAVELAKDIHNPQEILKGLGLTEDDYQAIKDTRAFKAMFLAASAEWNAAGNTQKRAKLKAAAMTEEALEMFWADIQERKETLNARVGLLNTLARIGGLGNPDPVANVGGNGQSFKLEIHLQGRTAPIIIDGERNFEVSEDNCEQLNPSSGSEDGLRESPLAANDEYDEL